jgi:hypothetical protein
MIRSRYGILSSLGLHLVSWKLLLPEFLHPIVSLIHHALDYVLSYLRYP